MLHNIRLSFFLIVENNFPTTTYPPLHIRQIFSPYHCHLTTHLTFICFQRKLLDVSLGFAAGVMVAASYWSLLAPAIEMATESRLYGREGEYAFVPVGIGFLVGAAFVYGTDALITSLGIQSPNVLLAMQSVGTHKLRNERRQRRERSAERPPQRVAHFAGLRLKSDKENIDDDDDHCRGGSQFSDVIAMRYDSTGSAVKMASGVRVESTTIDGSTYSKKIRDVCSTIMRGRDDDGFCCCCCVVSLSFDSSAFCFIIFCNFYWPDGTNALWLSRIIHLYIYIFLFVYYFSEFVHTGL